MSKPYSRKHYQQYLRCQKRVTSRTQKDSRSFRPCAHQTINQLIRYIVGDKMSVNAANVSHNTGKSYYGDFLSHPSHAIPAPPSNYISHTST
jgi:hypothetical protein